MNVVECLYCGENIKIKSTPKVNQYLTCPFCKSVLQISSVSPLTIHPLEDDWDVEDDAYSHKQNRKGASQQARHTTDEFEDQREYGFAKGKSDSGKRNPEKSKKHRQKLDFEMED